MVYIMYCIRDNVAEECSPPGIAKNPATAERMFRENKDIAATGHAEDFSLKIIGKFNSETGEVSECGSADWLKGVKDNE